MIKKYFALSLIAASVVVAGCSSDDNPAVPDVTTPAADPTNNSSAFDVIANSADHTDLLAAINSVAGLADTLDDPANEFTIFAPTNAAFAAADAALTADNAAVARVLSFHVVSGTLTETAISDGVNSATEAAPYTATSLLADPVGTLTFTNPAAGLSVNTVVIATAGLAPTGEGATGVVHSIGTVLTPPAVPATGGGDGGGDGTGTGDGTVTEGAGTAQAALELANIYTEFLQLFGAESYDTNAWTIFAPTDDAIANATGAAADGQNHIAVNAGPKTAADLIADGSITTNGGIEYAVTGTADALMVGGFNAVLLATGDAGALIYSIDGVLQ
jgi:transforming growth factor-beta-induced protein